MTVNDALGIPVWTVILGIHAAFAAPAAARGESRHDVKVLGEPRVLPADLIEAIARRFVADVRAALSPWRDHAADRERAIAAAVRQRHARIAADLLQPGLFDHRAERRAASQAAVLDEALACHMRLDALARLAELKPDAPTVRFVVLLP
jgi:hypothetical protein